MDGFDNPFASPQPQQPQQQQYAAGATGSGSYANLPPAQQQQQGRGTYAQIPGPNFAVSPQTPTHQPPGSNDHPLQTFASPSSQHHAATAQQQHQPQTKQNLVTPPTSGNMNNYASMQQQKSAALAAASKREKALEQKMLITRTPDEETEDGRIRNPEAAAKIRDAWIFKQIRARQDEFTGYRQALCFVGTWNVAAKAKDQETLDEWLCADWGPNGQYQPDIVCVGFQEIVDLNAVNVAVDNKTQQRSQYWVEKIRQTLNSAKNTQNNAARSYYLLMQRSMVGLLICVFIKAPHQNRVKYVQSSSVGVGVMGMMGNKGGVSIRLQFYDSTLCFVCSHLAAHRENVTGRNADFHNVFNKSNFDVGEEAIRDVIRSGSLSHWAIGSSSIGIPDHDLIFWFGDLNYRIDESMPTEKVLQYASKNQFDKLRHLDQLNIERSHGRSFDGFQEGVLNFPPTYKYQPGTNVYEQRPEKKLRAPAWCDRILWLSQDDKAQPAQQLTYNRSQTPIFSDHKAVYSTLRLTIKDVMREKREAIYTELMKLLDKYENQSLPIVGLDRVNLNFGEVRYNQSLTLPIQVTNTGNVVAQFRLVPKLDENTLCKPWLTVSPTYGMLIPGESPATLNVTVTIDSNTAHLLNQGREVLNDILILRLENGRDYYITVNAKYARSCFGMSVEELVLYSDPIRNIPLDPIERAEKFDGPNTNPSSALCVPKELWRVVDAICEKGLHEQDLFIQPGIAEEVNAIRECLDTGTAFAPQYRIHSFCEVFVSFFTSLSTPIVTPKLFPTIEIDSQNIQSITREILEKFPPIHYNVFLYVISFFREALLYREMNKLTAAKLARIGCNCVAPIGTGSSSGSGSGSGDPSTQQYQGGGESSGASPSSGNAGGSGSGSLQGRSGMQLIMLHLLETSSI